MLRLRDLRKGFGTLTAVDGLSLEIRRGEVFGLLGPNGAGKSTTIGMCVGVLRPDAGEVSVGEWGSPTRAAAREHIGLAPQSIALYDNLTARENLSFFGSLYGLKGRVLSERVERLLSTVGLSDRAGSRVGGFSGGMKRRLNLAAALVNDPSLVLLDEPTAGVDPQSRNALFEQVRALKDAGKTVVYTTHYMEEAQRLCDRIAVIERGRLLALGGVDELIARHGGESTVVVQRAEGESVVRTGEPLAELQRALGSEGVISARVERPNLESVFLNLTGRSLRD
ncbi:MAG: ABC transporter ATP-binding protein [Planctomycetes bacterium]|nr:ABC transporter ATP-binding protein [Planctomycetota bacterium]